MDFRICVLYTYLTVFHLLGNLNCASACSSTCTCTTIPPKDDGDSGEDLDPNALDDNDDDLDMPQTPRGKKVNCSNNPYRFTSIEDFNKATTIPLDTIYLDLSKNDITVIRKGSFNRLTALQRLDLSDNKISRIEPGAFEGLANLRRLNLSNNLLASINSSIFQGLPDLQKLMISFNKLNTIPEGTFNDLPDLRRLEFQSDYLRCDCHLQWIVKWARDKKVRIKSSTVCAVPKELRGAMLKKLKKKDLHCNRPLELPLFEILPDHSQIVFEGDKIPFECRASKVHPATQMYWLRHGVVVETNRSSGIFVPDITLPDDSIMLHSLVLEDLKTSHSGEWKCMVSTPQGNVTKSVSIVVLDSQALHCERNTTKTKKGVYVWDLTVAGITKDQPCKLGKGMVTHTCDRMGHWTRLNHDVCSFTNKRTRILQSLAKDTNSSKILNDAKNLEKLVSAPFLNDEDPLSTVNTDYVDLASQTLYRISQHADQGEDLVRSVLYSASRIMNFSSTILNDAQRQSKSLSRIAKAVESIPSQVKIKGDLHYSQAVEFIVMDVWTLPRQRFNGIQCSRVELSLDLNIQQMVAKQSSDVFLCGETGNDSQPLSFMNLAPLTSISIPRSVIHKPPTPDLPTAADHLDDGLNDDLDNNLDTDLDNEDEDSTTSNVTTTSTTTTTTTIPTTTPAPAPSPNITFSFIWYQSPSLFPVFGRHDDPLLKGREWKVVSGVISATLSEPAVNLTEPVVITFEVPETNKNLVPAYWDFQAKDGFGDWRTDGCDVVEKQRGLVTVHCDHLTAFAILEDQSAVRVSMFQMMQIVVYIGSCICLLCLMAVIITYVSCFRFLNVPRKMKHSVINISASILLLIICFTMGIKRTDHVKMCQVVGIALHYLSMVTMFWFTVTASNMLKKFTKAEKPPPPPVDLPMPLPPKPMIRFYLLAWGVPSIICGITAAVSFKFYDEPEYCFLEWNPGLGAFIGPVSFLFLLNLFFFVRISCVIHGSTGPLLNLEETQELQITDIEMTSGQQDRDRDRIDTQSITSDTSSKSSVSSVMDYERRPITQLRALMTALVLFIVSWVCGAIAVAKPFASAVPFQEIIFSYLYGVFCAILGLFMLIYYCLARKDSRTSWKRFFLCEQQTLYRTNHVGENAAPQLNGHVTTGSGKDISNCNTVTAKVVTTNSVSGNHIIKSDDECSSIQLVPSKPPSLIDSSLNNSANEVTAASFYNPRQNGVAKKFWDKKNKHNSKLITREMAKSLNMNASESESNFSASERPPKGGNHGYTSDGNGGSKHHNRGLAMQNGLDSDGGLGRPGGQVQAPPSYNSIMSSSVPPVYQHGEGGGPGDSLMGSPNCSIVSYTSSQMVPHHTRSPSSSSLGGHASHNHTSAFAVVPPRNNTLPRQTCAQSHSSPNSPERDIQVDNMVSGPSSVARLGDFDGSSQVSSNYSHERQRSPRPNDIQYLPGYPSPQPPDGFNNNNNARFKQYGLIDASPPPVGAVSPPVTHRNRANSGGGGYSSDNSGRYKRKLDNSFIQQVEQRIPQGTNNSNHVNTHNNHKSSNHVPAKNSQVNNHVTSKPPISPVSDGDMSSRMALPDSDSQIHSKKPRHNDSDHNSEPLSQSHKHKTRESHKHSKHRGMTKQRSLDWDSQFKAKSPTNSIPYAYVNHNYTDRVMQKLVHMAKNSQIDPNSKAFWIPRSSSSYNDMVQQEGARLFEDSSDSSSNDDDDSLDNIWVLQKQKKKNKNKKETSV